MIKFEIGNLALIFLVLIENQTSDIKQDKSKRSQDKEIRAESR